MPLYSLATTEHAILTFSARDDVVAPGFAENDFILRELTGLKTPEGTPLWDGRAELTVRPATDSERAVWEADIPHAIRDQVTESREQALSDSHFEIGRASCRERV